MIHFANQNPRSSSSKGLESKLNILPRHLVDAGKISLHPIPGCRVRRVSAHGTHRHLAQVDFSRVELSFSPCGILKKKNAKLPKSTGLSRLLWFNVVYLLYSCSVCTPLSDTSNSSKTSVPRARNLASSTIQAGPMTLLAHQELHLLIAMVRTKSGQVVVKDGLDEVCHACTGRAEPTRPGSW